MLLADLGGTGQGQWNRRSEVVYDGSFPNVSKFQSLPLLDDLISGIHVGGKGCARWLESSAFVDCGVLDNTPVVQTLVTSKRWLTCW